jgi:hypothetical protein
MPIRRATRADIPAMIELRIAAFAQDAMFRILYPHQDEHPQAYRQDLTDRLWQAWYNFSVLLTVAYELVDRNDLAGGDATSSQQELITGWAQWKRAGQGWEHVHGVLGKWDPREIALSASRISRLTHLAH